MGNQQQHIHIRIQEREDILLCKESVAGLFLLNNEPVATNE